MGGSALTAAGLVAALLVGCGHEVSGPEAAPDGAVSPAVDAAQELVPEPGPDGDLPVLRVWPDNRYQTMRYGTDTKLNVAKFLAARDPDALAGHMFGDIEWRLLRVPIFPALQESSEGR